MPELRKDPIIGRWVIISTARGKGLRPLVRPRKNRLVSFALFVPAMKTRPLPKSSPFAPPASQPDTPGWSLRVVPNKFPALRIEGELDRRAEGMYDKMNGIGAHEVIIESPEHHDTLATVSPSHLEKILLAYRSRINELYKDSRFKFISVFRNQGEAAGASLAHPHSQMIALPIVPKRLMEELQGSQDHFHHKERCVYCDIIRQEKEHGARIISANQDFLSLAPFASRFPFETWILPQRHSSSFEEIPEHLYASLADIFSETVKRLAVTLNDPPYNIMLHTSPLSRKGKRLLPLAF